MTIRMRFEIAACIFFGALFVAMFIKDMTVPKRAPRAYVEDVIPIALHGEVAGIDLGRGFKVWLKNDPHIYRLGGATNNSIPLADVLRFGDTLLKDSGSAEITLRRGGAESRWWIDIPDSVRRRYSFRPRR